MSQNLSSAAVVIGALRVNHLILINREFNLNFHIIFIYFVFFAIEIKSWFVYNGVQFWCHCAIDSLKVIRSTCSKNKVTILRKCNFILVSVSHKIKKYCSSIILIAVNSAKIAVRVSSIIW